MSLERDQCLCHTLHIHVSGSVCVTHYTYMSVAVSVSHITQVQQFV